MIDPDQIKLPVLPDGGEHLNVQISPCGTKIWVCIDGSCVFRYRGLSVITIDDQRETRIWGNNPNIMILDDLPFAAETSDLVGQHQRDVQESAPIIEPVKLTIEDGISDDHRGRKSKLGIPYKSGTKEYARAYYARNKEKMNERTKKWQRENRDKVNEYQKGLREETKQELRKTAALTEHKRRFEDIFDHEGSGSFGSGNTQENPEDKNDEQQ